MEVASSSGIAEETGIAVPDSALHHSGTDEQMSGMSTEDIDKYYTKAKQDHQNAVFLDNARKS